MTNFVSSTVTVQLAVPLQPPPDQPMKFEPLSGIAVRVTTVPSTTEIEQDAPQLIPVGLLVTVPLPAPVLLTVRSKAFVAWVNVAETVRSELTVTTQLPVPLQLAPDQPSKIDPDCAAADR